MLCGLGLDESLAGSRYLHAYLQGCSQPAPVGALELGQNIWCPLMTSKEVVVGAPQK